MKTVLTALVVSALLIVTMASAVMAQRGGPEPVLPAEVMTEFDYGGWENGVYTRIVGNRIDGQTGCQFIVAVGAESVGAVLEGTINGAPVTAVVQPYYFAGQLHHGRATFSGAAVGDAMVTTNTVPIVGASC